MDDVITLIYQLFHCTSFSGKNFLYHRFFISFLDKTIIRWTHAMEIFIHEMKEKNIMFPCEKKGLVATHGLSTSFFIFVCLFQFVNYR